MSQVNRVLVVDDATNANWLRQRRRRRNLSEVKDASGHEHAPAGASTGGQFVSQGGSGGGGTDSEGPALPRIEDSPGSFLIRHTLEDAKLPANHYDGLAGISFHEGSWIRNQNPGGTVTDASGTYNPASRQIMLALNAPGGGNIHVFGGNVVLHEVGHHVHLAKLTTTAAIEWSIISELGTHARISAYARTNEGEHFAEAYRAYTAGGRDRRTLKTVEPKAYQFMQNVTRANSHMLHPPGQFASVSHWRDRYLGGAS